MSSSALRSPTISSMRWAAMRCLDSLSKWHELHELVQEAWLEAHERTVAATLA